MANLREILAYVFVVLAFVIGFVWLTRTYAVYTTAKIDRYWREMLISTDIVMGLLSSLLAYLLYKDNKKITELSDRCRKLEQEKESKTRSEQA